MKYVFKYKVWMTKIDIYWKQWIQLLLKLYLSSLIAAINTKIIFQNFLNNKNEQLLCGHHYIVGTKQLHCIIAQINKQLHKTIDNQQKLSVQIKVVQKGETLNILTNDSKIRAMSRFQYRSSCTSHSPRRPSVS